MTRKFCPDYGALPTHLGYRPMHAWFADEKLKLTTFKDGPRYFGTFGEARQAAKDFVTQHINGRDRSESIEIPHDPLIDEVQEFITRRAQEEAEERARVFGDAGPSTIYPGHGRPAVVVEMRRRRA
ncbi:hypothetical protein [Mesorhizobium sp. CAU 1741]|uniref:hypothetical protein n=1 Tax=Mesorhizobium sp. CAU 1741 TaxID=3140366 RepID=UPI00325A67DB